MVDESRSFACLRKNDGSFVGSQYYSHLESLPWKQELSSGSGKLTRYSCWLVNQGCQCDYKYGSKDHPFSQTPDWLVNLTEKVAARIGVDVKFLNSICGNKYATEQHDCTWHGDNEPYFRASEFCRDTFIVSLSFGASRRFEFRKKQSDHVIPIDLEDGDLLCMLGRIQDFFLHRLCSGGVKRCSGASSSSSLGSSVRFNLTWRFLQQHEPSCPMAN